MVSYVEYRSNLSFIDLILYVKRVFSYGKDKDIYGSVYRITNSHGLGLCVPTFKVKKVKFK